MKKKKLVLPVLIVWLMALTASGWLGSFILVKIASLPTDNLQWNTYFSTLAYYGWQPSLKKIPVCRTCRDSASIPDCTCSDSRHVCRCSGEKNGAR